MENLENSSSFSNFQSSERTEKEEMNTNNFLVIPESEIKLSFSRSSGKGGQNVNKVSTKAEVRWQIDSSTALTDEQKAKIKKKYPNRINEMGEFIVVSQKARTQKQNRETAIHRLNKLVREALIPEKERIPTNPSKASKERRLEEKKRQAKKKKLRRKSFSDYE